MGDYLKLIRPLNCFMSAVAVFIGGMISAWDGSLSAGETNGILVAMLAVFLFVAAGNSLNDYEDRDIDKIAHPDRPVAAGRMSPRSALRLSYAFFFLSAVASTLIFYPKIVVYPLALLLLNMVIMLSYEKRLKKEGISGNLSIAWLTASLFLFGAVSAGGINTLTALFVFMAFLAIFAREVAKDIEDMEGDRGVRRTAPLTYGVGRASVFAYVSIIAAVAISPLPYILGIVSPYYLAFVLPADAIFIYSVLLLAKKSPAGSQNWAKAGMLVSLVAFAVGVFA
jgi:geranylgeranylglycerol-phosphate geranylgeranyltransferase